MNKIQENVIKIKIGFFVSPKKSSFILDKYCYLVEGVKEYYKTSYSSRQMLKLKGNPLYFDSKEFEIISSNKMMNEI